MKILAIVAFITLSLTSVSARNSNPRHKLTVTMENYVLQEQIGQELHRLVIDFHPFFDFRFGCTVGDVEDYPCAHKKAFNTLEQILIIHPDLHSASNEYLSWIMVQAMAKMVLEKRYQLAKYPRIKVIEIEQMVMLTAQKFWNQLNPPMSDDLDLYRTSDYNIAFTLDLSVLSFTKAYNQNPRINFYNKVALRATRYDGVYLSVSDIIESGNFSENEKEIARNILVDFEHSL
ncbi:hypothetical protein [Halobacteriovorax sp.]|uniref:hypothetical protein n=1 Tax=Halobacteriovorax sp. TaxID=2020862 RepID=UPI003564FC10